MWSPTVRSNELYLRHAGGAIKSNDKGKFKYIAKMGEGENARYFYSQAEIDAYKQTLSKEELENTHITMLTEEDADKERSAQNASKELVNADKSKKEAAKPSTEEEKKEDDKKKKSGSGGGGKGKGGSGKGKKGKKGKGKGKDSSKDDDKVIEIGEMLSYRNNKGELVKKYSDGLIMDMLNTNPKVLNEFLKSMGLSKKETSTNGKVTASDLKESLAKNNKLKGKESLSDLLQRTGTVKMNKKGTVTWSKRKLKHSDFWSPSVRPDELYHWGFWGRNKNDHKYIEKIKEGNHVRYFYSQDELDAYRNLKKEVENPSVKSEGTSAIGKAKHFVEYDLTGRGYKRDAREQNKKIDELNKMRKAHPLKADTDELMDYRDRKLNVTSDKSGGKKKEVENRQKLKEIERDRMDYINDAKSRNKRIENASEFEKRRNLEKAEQEFKDKSLVGNLTKVGDTIHKINRNIEDAKVADFMNKNRGTSEQWMKDLNIDKKDYDPEKDKGPRGSNKLKKVLRDRAMIREDESLNEFLEKHGYAENKKGKRKYYRNSIKHFLESDLDLYSLIVDSEELMHHGRKGMKWYQHIYGPFQSIARYARGAGSKIADAKSTHDAKAEAKWEKKKEKIIRSGDSKKVQKYSQKMTDDELRRADNRISEKSKLDGLNGKDVNKGKQYVQQQGNQQSRDLLKDFANIANTISTTYNSFDKIVTTIDSAKKYTPEGRAKEAKIKDIISNLKIDEVLSNPAQLSDKQMSDLNTRYKNYTNLKKLLSSQTESLSSTDSVAPSYLSDFSKKQDPNTFVSYKDFKRSNKKGTNNTNDIDIDSLVERLADEMERRRS